jgi:hypothetical protein
MALPKILDSILNGDNPSLGNLTVGFDTNSIIRMALALLTVGLLLIMFGVLAAKKPLIALGVSIIVAVATAIYYSQAQDTSAK